jgi:hypothetical protein
MRDFPWCATPSFKPLHKICDFDLMFDGDIRDGQLHKAEAFLDTFDPFILAQRRESLRDSLEQCAGRNFRGVRGAIKILDCYAARTNRSKSRSTPANGNHARDPVAAYRRSRGTANVARDLTQVARTPHFGCARRPLRRMVRSPPEAEGELKR